MRFVDSNVFIYALLKPRKEPDKEIKKIKQTAVDILNRIQNREKVAITVVHIGEIANVIESKANLNLAIEFLKELMLLSNVRVLSVSEEEYLEALILAEDRSISINDSLAYVVMKRESIEEIYSFDRHFDQLDLKVIRE